MVHKLVTFYETVPYCTPELFEGKGYDGHTIDVCILDVVLYIMLTDCFNYQGNNHKEIKQKTLAGNYSVKFKLSLYLCDIIAKLSLNLDEGH